MTDCTSQNCKSANKCLANPRSNCPRYPGAPTYPQATPKELRTRCR